MAWGPVALRSQVDEHGCPIEEEHSCQVGGTCGQSLFTSLSRAHVEHSSQDASIGGHDNGEGKKHYAHHAQNTSCHRPVATRMEKRPCLLSPLVSKSSGLHVLICACPNQPATKWCWARSKGKTIMVGTSGHFGCKAEAYLFYCCSSRENQFWHRTATLQANNYTFQ